MMAQPVIFECALCDATHRGRATDLPPAWRWVDGALTCGDCAPVDQSCEGSALIVSETSMPLLSGCYLDLADPDCSIVQPIDIAAGLRQPRFSAQTRGFYTIAQHSLLVLRLVAPIARSLGGAKGLQLRRCALMHDSAEAIIHDITSPLKRQLPDYRAIEARFEARLAERFGWSWTDFRRDTVKRADLQALAIEQRDLLGSADAWPILERIDRDQLTSIKITRCWHPDEAQDRFLGAFADLFPDEERMAA